MEKERIPSTSKRFGNGMGRGRGKRLNKAGVSSPRMKQQKSDSIPLEEQAWLKKFKDFEEIPGFDSSFVTAFINPTSVINASSRNTSQLTPVDPLLDLGEEICKFLDRNGVISVGIASNFPKRVLPMKMKILDESDNRELMVNVMKCYHPSPNENEVTVVILFDAASFLEQEVMYDVVKNAFVNAKYGLILLADIRVMTNPIERKWMGFLQYLAKQGIWSDHLRIACNLHSYMFDVKSAAEFRRIGQLQGCGEPCPLIKNKHSPLLLIDLDSAEDRPLKPEPETKRYKNDAEVSGKIEFPMERRLPCGHVQLVKCPEDLENENCGILVGCLLPCKHGYAYPCNGKAKQIIPKCTLPVLTELPCGHETLVTCEIRTILKGIPAEEINCPYPCSAILPCGHPCPKMCHFDTDPEHEKGDLQLCLEPCAKTCPRGVHIHAEEHLCHEKDICEAPCKKVYYYTMKCEHYVKITCSDPDPNLEGYVCRAPCKKRAFACDHPCPKRCGEKCGFCEELVDCQPLACKMKHKVKKLCSDSIPVECNMKLETYGECGHKVVVTCSEKSKLNPVQITMKCTKPCKGIFSKEGECGHKCRGRCGQCFNFGLTSHARCMEPCKRVLVCGHECATPCPKSCRPCPLPCENVCEHQRCELECGVPCVPTCAEPCAYSCNHSACSKKCSEPCDKPLCYFPCPKTLNCGHPCVGYCGEICPKLCGVCDAEKLKNEVLYDEEDEEDRFIYLERCGHTLKANFLKMWIESNSSSSSPSTAAEETATQQILPLRCPLCLTRLNWIRRFSFYFHENWNLVNAVRRKIFGDEEEIDGILNEATIGFLKTFYEEQVAYPFKNDFRGRIMQKIEGLRHVRGSDARPNFFRSMDIRRAQFTSWVMNELINGCKEIARFKAHITSLPEHLHEEFCVILELYLRKLFYRKWWPIHQNEALDLQMERRRIGDCISFFNRLVEEDIPNQSKAYLFTYHGHNLVLDVSRELVKFGLYTDKTRSKVLEKMTRLDQAMNVTLNVTEKERKEIVGAFGDRSGRWFKCRNGHVYVITECGGAEEIGVCNECGEFIGGKNHRMLEENYLSSEMDGATDTLYPNVLN